MATEITQNDIQDISSKVRRSVENAHRKLALEVYGNLREFSPVDHGRLAGSWTISRGALESTISTNVEYAAAQDQGTSPHDIYPSSARALRFNVGSSVVFATHVHHPGTEGKHFVDKSVDKARDRVSDFVEQALSAEGLI